jgi:hypothetical protein
MPTTPTPAACACHDTITTNVLRQSNMSASIDTRVPSPTGRPGAWDPRVGRNPTEAVTFESDPAASAADRGGGCRPEVASRSPRAGTVRRVSGALIGKRSLRQCAGVPCLIAVTSAPPLGLTFRARRRALREDPVAEAPAGAAGVRPSRRRGLARQGRRGCRRDEGRGRLNRGIRYRQILSGSIDTRDCAESPSLANATEKLDVSLYHPTEDATCNGPTGRDGGEL